MVGTKRSWLISLEALYWVRMLALVVPRPTYTVPTVESGSFSSWMLLRVEPVALATALEMAEAGKVTAVFLGVTP